MIECYSTGLSYDARAWAQLTGIAFGWVTETPTDREKRAQRIRAGCERCRFCMERAVTFEELDTMREQPAEDVIKGHVWQMFRYEAERRWCTHVPVYEKAQDDAELVRAKDTVAMLLVHATLRVG